VQAITGEAKHVHIIDQAKCTKCGTCLEFCPPKVSAIVRVTGEEAINLKTLEKPIPTASARAST
jgi:Na+-translocating ferredoxin:NAD+ oxidoreductase RNF subunit RnfB